MSKLVWDLIEERLFETGLRKGVLYPMVSGAYPAGVVWNGLTGVTESPDGAEPTDLYADDILYATLRSAEKFNGTIEAYTYPDEFGVCDGSVEPAPGLKLGQQKRTPFGLSYVTQIGSAADEEEGYKLHLVYGATASPSEKAYQAINDSPEAITFSWEFTTVPVPVEGFKPTASLTIDSTKVAAAKLAALEAILYGSETDEARLPLPDEVITLLTEA